MGQQEFTTPLASFNQAQLDQIELDTDEIVAAVDQIQHTDLSNVAALIGHSTDLSGVGTLFSKLLQVINATTGLSGQIDANKEALYSALQNLIGANGNAPGDNTLYARLAYLKAVADNIRGVDVPAIQSHLSDTQYMIAMGLNSKPGVSGITVSAAIGTWYTILDVSGVMGKLQRVSAYSASTTTQYISIRITCDGNQIVTSGAVAMSLYETSNKQFDLLQQLNFANSLKVEIMQNTTIAGTSIRGMVEVGYR